jgi:thioredoxin 1
MKISHHCLLGKISLLLLALLGWLALPAWGQGAPPGEAPKPAILDFGRGLCANCKLMEQILGKIKERYGDQVEVRLLYIDKDEPIFRQYRIVIVPAQVFLDASGKEVFRHTGVFPLELLEQRLRELKFINRGAK